MTLIDESGSLRDVNGGVTARQQALRSLDTHQKAVGVRREADVFGEDPR